MTDSRNFLSSTPSEFGKPPPQISEREWAERVPAQIIRAGIELADSAFDTHWTPPIVSGRVKEGARRFLASIDLSKRKAPVARCTCDNAAGGKICKHALAVYFSFAEKLRRARDNAKNAGAATTNSAAATNHCATPFPATTIDPATTNPSATTDPATTTNPSDNNTAFPRQISVPRDRSVIRAAATKPKPHHPAPATNSGSFSRREIPATAHGEFRRLRHKSRPQIDGNEQWLSISLPQRSAPLYAEIYEKIKAAGFDLDVRSELWFLRGEHAVLCFLAREWKDFHERFSPKVSPQFNTLLQKISFAKLKTDVAEAGDDFEISVGINAFGATPAEIDHALASSRPYLKSRHGRIVLIPSDISAKMERARDRLARGARYAGTPNFRRKISRVELAATESLLEEMGVNFEAPETWRRRSGALRDLSKLVPAPVPEPLNSRLRIYQQIGVAWLWHLRKNGLGGVLADEMGLGKTVEAIAFAAAFFSEIPASAPARILVVAPAGLVENWRRELANFFPEIPVLVHHGQKRSAEILAAFPRGIVLTSYAVLRIDNDDFISAGTWQIIIADEAQQVKNRRSRNSRALREIPAETRFVLTGTPVENSIEDLRAIFDFVLPGFMPKPVTAGGAIPIAERREQESETIRALAAPYILRRTKSFVAPELPPRIEQKIWCKFDDVQARFYADWKEKSHKEFFELEMSGASDSKLRFAAFSQLLRLRQICTEPRLLDPDFPAESSAKLRALRELLDEAITGGHRVLVFSQFVSVLAFIKDALREDGIAFDYIDGKTKNRAEICERFNNSDTPVCLISLKAGGVGLNLTGADIVVHCDPWWNPAVEEQATDRAHRIGQTRAVTSIKLVVADSVEERVLELQAEKRALIRSVFEASDLATAKISLADIKSLLE